MSYFLMVTSFAQEVPKKEIDLEDFIERVFPIQEQDLDYEAIYEVLFQLYQNPIDINEANAEILQATYLLKPYQIESILNYRQQFGPFLSLYELQAIPEIGLEDLLRLAPFLQLGKGKSENPKDFFSRIPDANQAYLLFRHRRTWERRRGFTPADTSSSGRVSSRYLGDPNEIYIRMRLQKTRDFSFGFTLEKDAGEQFVWDRSTNRIGFNFYSFHLAKYNLGKWKNITLGDFQAAFGQGLVFGAGFILGKGAETVSTVRRSSVGILPYTAALEFGFFRGLGATYQFNRDVKATIIASRVPRDGRLQNSLDSLLEESGSFSSINQSGLHRTNSEIATKNQLKETSLGVNLEYSRKSFSGGLNFLSVNFDRPWQPTPRPYNQFDFKGDQNQNASTYFNYNWKNFFAFGEAAISTSGGTGIVAGIIGSLRKEVSMSILYRNYDRDFHSFYSNAFSESTRPNNERGIYLGLELNPIKKWKLNLHYDFFKFPWLRFRAYAPSNGYEWLSRLTFRPGKTLTTFIQIRQEQKERNISDTGESQLGYQLAPLNRINGLWNLDKQLSTRLFIRSRIMWSKIKFNENESYGFLILQDIKLHMDRWRLTGRISLFDTDDYDARLYAFESNVLWTFSIPAFSGRGIRYYLLAQYQVHPRLTLYMRIARTSFSDRKEVSSGLQTIQGNNQTDTHFLVKYDLFK
ncbi:ComEA family DNA-binding protein [Algoriphagus sediminis]|uniref:Helix-hairpin-helix domain-containing protein n=1 Tax=Algoriphagus sediminis TaxID=3057113 RepID=A0ABT7Y7T4_9BACT|nr:helix-hairpin-helix domain-containing protein [Algoriphagus sediminis]MDN3202581.1 helix-hairpin-helix domain-containing protein [Algoriphagus sediminis]